MNLYAQPLTADAFGPFGDVIETANRKGCLINDGSTRKFADLARLELENGGRAALHIFRAAPAAAPIPIALLERHLLGSQAFVPLHGRPFPVVVAAPADDPRQRVVRAFITDGRQGVNLRPGTWHHHLLCIGEPSDFLVIDRHSDAEDCEFWQLDSPLMLQLGPIP